MSNWFTNTWTKLTTEVKVLCSLFDADVWPIVKNSVLFFLSAEGKVILQAAQVAAPTVATNWTAAVTEVAGAAIAAAPGIIDQDATQTLNYIQTALQAVKTAQGIVSPGDQSSLQAVQSAVSGASNPSAGTQTETPAEGAAPAEQEGSTNPAEGTAA